jgi:3-deoxy-D-manno-octulosonic-acid transferase
MFIIYKWFLYLLYVLLQLVYWGSLGMAGSRYGLRWRFKPMVQGKFDIWWHGASAGEVKQCINWALDMYGRTGRSAVITTHSVSGWRVLQEAMRSDGKLYGLKGVSIAWAPLDIPFVVRRFIRDWEVKDLIFYEGELWPFWWQEAWRNEVRISLLSWRLRSRGRKMWEMFVQEQKKPGAPQELWGRIGTLNKCVADLLQGAGWPAVSEGEWKCFWSVPEKDTLEQLAQKNKEAGVAPLPFEERKFDINIAWISVHKEEWKFLKEYIPSGESQRWKGYNLVCVPRYLDELPLWKKLWQAHGYEVEVVEGLPEVLPASENARVYLVDAFGQVRKVAGRAQWAVLGGGWTKRYPLHNYRELLAVGAPVFVNPRLLQVVEQSSGSCAEDPAWRKLVENKLIQGVDSLQAYLDDYGVQDEERNRLRIKQYGEEGRSFLYSERSKVGEFVESWRTLFL